MHGRIVPSALHDGSIVYMSCTPRNTVLPPVILLIKVLASFENIHFEFIDILLGVAGYTILYKRENGAIVTGIIETDGHGKAIHVRAHYSKPK